MPAILAIESSCDDTSAAVVVDGVVMSNITSSQAIHAKYGGVVPELASRDHQKNISQVADLALDKAGIGLKNLSAIGYTRGPGLLGSLLVGASFAKGMALGLDLPLIEVDHLEAHVLAHFIDDPKPGFPFLCLLVSGGHTQIVMLDSLEDQKTLGKTIDDAAGEAFDKGAKILGLPYPGGPLIDSKAKEGDDLRFSFAQPKVAGYDYSFSGLKTSLLYFLRDQLKEEPHFIENNLNDLCASFQKSIVDYLLSKLEKCIVDTRPSHLGMAGGVAANSALRQGLAMLGEKYGIPVYVPDFEYCTDNAGMIAIAAWQKYIQSEFSPLDAEPYSRQAGA